MTYKPYCVDIFQGDDVVGANDEGLAQVKAFGIAFMDHKASQGTGEVDQRCALRRAKWMSGDAISVTDVDGTTLQLQPKFGFYHFNGGYDATAEANHFKASVLAAGYKPGDDLCLDWEDIGASGHQMPATWADQFCDVIEQWCGYNAKVYGGDAPREQFNNASASVVDRFSARPFWFCQYGILRPALIPLPWQKVGLYQFQDDGDSFGPGPHTIPGIERYCDNSTVVGSMTVAKLYAAWGGGKSASA